MTLIRSLQCEVLTVCVFPTGTWSSREDDQEHDDTSVPSTAVTLTEDDSRKKVLHDR